ncbi:MAG: hypothetical protein K8R88_05790 [Armatimonadetes bacterium]|nr:hypothetical protein [Armatimonadota bacterium]
MLPLILWTWLSFVSLSLVCGSSNWKIKQPEVRDALLIGLLFSLTIGVSFFIAALNGFQVSLSFGDIYERRLAARDAVPTGGLVGYITSLLAFSFAPLSLAIGFSRKNYALIFAGLFAVVCIFSFSGTKSSILTPLLILILFTFAKQRSRFGTLNWLAGFSVFVTFSSLVWTQIQNPALSAAFTNRLIVSRGISLAHFWDVYRDRPIYMGDSTLASVLSIPPAPAKTYAVGAIYGFSEQDNYNASIWASAYANFGYVGIVIAGVAAGIVLKLYNALSVSGDRIVTCAMAGMLAMVWSDASFEGSLVTHGLVFTLPYLFLLKAQTHENQGDAVG